MWKLVLSVKKMMLFILIEIESSTTAKRIVKSNCSGKSFRCGVSCTRCEPEGVLVHVERWTPVQIAPHLKLLKVFLFYWDTF